jgi:hypothetical protein
MPGHGLLAYNVMGHSAGAPTPGRPPLVMAAGALLTSQPSETILARSKTCQGPDTFDIKSMS